MWYVPVKESNAATPWQGVCEGARARVQPGACMQALGCCCQPHQYACSARPACSLHGMQDPTCAKLSISGRMRRVPKRGLEEAERLLFARHPAMRDWPAGHQFSV